MPQISGLRMPWFDVFIVLVMAVICGLIGNLFINDVGSLGAALIAVFLFAFFCRSAFS